MSCRNVIITAVVFFGTLVRPQAQDNPQATSGSWRPTVVAQHGMVAAGHPLAAEAGMRILKAGGNAIDAAMATWAVQGEVEPGMTGLGADMFVLYLHREDRRGEVHQRHRLRAAGGDDRLLQLEGRPARRRAAVDLPCPAPSAARRTRVKTYGTKPLAEVLAPAIEIAEQGFPITEALARGLAGGRDKLAKWPSTTKVWFKDGKPLQMGDILVNPQLARTLRAIAAQGPDAFYKGEIAKNTAAFLKANGGIITEADLAALSAVRGHAGATQLPRRRRSTSVRRTRRAS